jgi:hypothetical protein
MSDITFEFEWADPLGARGEELRATWARLSIIVADRPASRLLDLRTQTVRDAVYLPLYPLAEWFVANWWRLLFEIESPARSNQAEYAERHQLRHAREGYSLPNLSFTAFGDVVQLNWSPESLVHHSVEFLEEGAAHVPLEQFRSRIAAFVTSVVGRLRDQGVLDTFLEREWNAITNVSSEEEQFCVAAAELGIDPFAADGDLAGTIINVSAEVPSTVRREFFAATAPAQLVHDASSFKAGIERARENKTELPSLLRLQDRLSEKEVVQRVRRKLLQTANGFEAPWHEGYDLAREARMELGVPDAPFPSFHDLAVALRLEEANLRAAMFEQPIPTSLYETIVATNRKGSPSFAMKHRFEHAERFQFCRGLGDFLLESGQEWLITRALSDRQKRNRAFAAEFLAPAAALRAKVSGSIVASEEVDELAAHFGVASQTIVHQLANHGIADVRW